MKLIDKDALVAEIEKLYQQHSSKEYIDEAGCVLYKLEDFINSLGVKEVDLEKEIPMWIKENPRERPFDDGWFIGMDDCLHRNGYKIKICDLWNLPKEPFNSKDFETI